MSSNTKKKIKSWKDGRIYCNINTSNNSILIGKAGVILRAINLIIKNAVSTTFKKRLEVSVDINGYKEERYKKVASMARRFGKTVLRTKADLKLDTGLTNIRTVDGSKAQGNLTLSKLATMTSVKTGSGNDTDRKSVV